MKNSNFFRNWIGIALLLISLVPSRAQTLGPNGHYYKVVLESGLTWEEARLKAAGAGFNAVQGYLATITSEEEDQLIEQLRIQAASEGEVALWVGGYQVADAASTNDGWTWINGEGPFFGTD